MCAFDPITLGLLAAGVGMASYSTIAQQSSQASMMQYQSEVAANNAALAQQQANNAEQNGALSLEQQQIKNSAALSQARAQMAANGLDLSSGSPLDVQNSDSTLGDLDASRIQNNTINQVYGFDTTAMNDQATSQADQYKASMSNWTGNMSLANQGLGLALS